MISGDLGGHGFGPLLPIHDLEKSHLKSHKPSNPSAEGHHVAETQHTARTLLIEEHRNVLAYPDKCLP